jgi:hypothetical protein
VETPSTHTDASLPSLPASERRSSNNT